jgi:hypothetical protein
MLCGTLDDSTLKVRTASAISMPQAVAYAHTQSGSP